MVIAKSLGQPLSPAAEAAAADLVVHRLLLFAVGGHVYGCEISAVREIIPFRRATRLPGAPPYVVGLINLRGTIVTVLDLGLRLGESDVDRVGGSIILVDFRGKLVGIGVDEVRDVQPLAERDVEAATGEHARGGIVRGLGRLGEHVVVLLDVQMIVSQVLL